MTVMYQIMNQLTGKKLYESWQGKSRWGDCGTYWKKPDTVKNKLRHLLNDFQSVAETTKYGTFTSKKPCRFRSELAPYIVILATEMQTIGATKAIKCEDFIQKELIK